MKKSLFALAVLAALSDAASAQTTFQFNSTAITFAGIVDVGVRRKGTPTGDDWSVGGSQSTYDALNLSGRQELPHDMYGFFYLNYRFKENDGTGNGTTNAGGTTPFFRQSWVGLGQKQIGEVKIGRVTMPMQMIDGGTEAFKTGTVASLHTAGINATCRASNAIYFRSANFAGFYVDLAVAHKGQDINEVGEPLKGYISNPLTIATHAAEGASLNYTSGPLYLGAAWDQNGSGMKTAGLYARYDFGFAQLLAEVERGDNYTSVPTTKAAPNEKVSQAVLSTIVPINDQVRVLFGDAHISSNLSNRDANKIGLGGEYTIIPKNIFYANVGKWSGDRISVANRKFQFDIGYRLFF